MARKTDIALVYVAGPYTAQHPHDREINIQNAWRLGIDVARLGALPVVPHANSAHLDGIQGHEFWIDATLELMRRCDAVILLPGWQLSRGSVGEVNEATRLRKPVFESLDELRAWLLPAETKAAE